MRTTLRVVSTAVLAPLAVVAPLAVLVGGCAGTKGLAPTLGDVEMRLTGVDFDGLDLAFDVSVDNPLPVQIPAPKLTYDFAVEGATLASARDAKGTAIPASRAGKLTLPMRVGYRDLAKVVKSLDGLDEAGYRFSGNVGLPALGQTFDVPFDKAGTFPVVRPPSVSVRNVDTSGLGVTGGRVVVEADFTNPNAFGMGIDDLGWALDLAGARIGGLRGSTGGSVGPKETRTLRLDASISAADALKGLLGQGAKGSGTRLVPTGSVQTPWGKIPLK